MTKASNSHSQYVRYYRTVVKTLQK
jgi:hypothetical protein